MSSFTVAPRTEALSILLAPILLLQARRTARTTPRLDPASGAEHGTVAGRGPALRIAVVGESTAVGVGAVRHAEALPGFLAGELRERLRRPVTWSATGRNGATARRVVTDVVPCLDGAPPDVVVVTVGINDLIRRRPLKAWAADLTELLAALRARYPEAGLLVAGMPPVHRFPALPQPLRRVMGGRARAMDRVTRQVTDELGAIHVPMDPDMAEDRTLFATDGLHPSPDGYRVWARGLAEAVPPLPAPPVPVPVQPGGQAPALPVVAAAAAPATPVVTVTITPGKDPDS